MSRRESIARHNLIIKKLRKKDATFQEIDDFLALESELQEYNFRVSQRTFQRDLEDIRSLYNIDIQYNYSRKVYYIDSESEPEANERILEAFDTFNALNISDHLSNFIHFEKRRPKGTENLYGLVHAIKNKLQISFSYQKFWDSESSIRTVEPIALKEFNNRWYILSKDFKDQQIKTFALDRLSELIISRNKIPEITNLDVNAYFQHAFGIISPTELKPEIVQLSLDAHQGKYIKSLPLHSSQRILKDTTNELIIELKIYITHDFIMEILSLGNNVKVLQPQSLIDEVKYQLKSALEEYN